jgi:endonuclease/exonuclease/phosphatase family metal-dependent hydrolase
MMKRHKIMFLVSVLLLGASACYVGVANSPPASAMTQPPSLQEGTARFVTLNIVHGTRMPVPNALVRASTEEANLRAIGDLLQAQQPTVVALQESIHGVDGGQTAAIARHGGFANWADDALVTSGAQRHASSLLSSVALEDPRSETLLRGTTRAKGWLGATVAVEAFAGLRVRVISVHLDPLSASVRARQVDQLAKELDGETLPLVVMGDFNCAWEETGCVQDLAKRLDLDAAPSDGTPTYAMLGIRRSLDWVLVSSPLEIRSARVLPVNVSDHRPVVVEVGVRKDRS